MSTMRMRTTIAALALSAAGIIGIAQHEGYTGRAIAPVKGDRATYGYGTTTRPDGSPVKMGEATTPVRALADLLRDSNRASNGLKRCIDAPLYQHEFDAFSSLAYNVGVGRVCQSSIPGKLAAGQYAEACKTILDFDGMCIQRNAAGKCLKKRVLRGLENRRAVEYRQCMGGDGAAG